MISFFFYCLSEQKIIKRLERTEFYWSMLRTGNKRQRRTDRWFASMETADGPMRGGYSPFRTGASAFRLSRLLLPNRRKNLCRQTKWYLFRPTNYLASTNETSNILWQNFSSIFDKNCRIFFYYQNHIIFILRLNYQIIDPFYIINTGCCR